MEAVKIKRKKLSEWTCVCVCWCALIALMIMIWIIDELALINCLTTTTTTPQQYQKELAKTKTKNLTENIPLYLTWKESSLRACTFTYTECETRFLLLLCCLRQSLVQFIHLSSSCCKHSITFAKFNGPLHSFFLIFSLLWRWRDFGTISKPHIY